MQTHRKRGDLARTKCTTCAADPEYVVLTSAPYVAVNKQAGCPSKMLQCGNCKRCCPTGWFVKLSYSSAVNWYILDRYKVCACCRKGGKSTVLQEIAKVWKEMKRQSLNMHNHSSPYTCEYCNIKVLPNSRCGHERTRRHQAALSARTMPIQSTENPESAFSAERGEQPGSI